MFCFILVSVADSKPQSSSIESEAQNGASSHSQNALAGPAQMMATYQCCQDWMMRTKVASMLSRKGRLFCSKAVSQSNNEGR
jgi:hypothetical protein